MNGRYASREAFVRSVVAKTLAVDDLYVRIEFPGRYAKKRRGWCGYFYR